MEKLKYYAISLVFSFVSALILLLISSAIFTYTNINDNYLNIFVFASIIISVVLGSIMLLRKLKLKGLIYGAVYGIIYILLIYLFTSLTYNGFYVNNMLFMYLGTSVLAGIVGGIIGVNI